eukprot:m51a1_g8757 hypothetical protein (91) ;mRNA; f:107729-108353
MTPRAEAELQVIIEQLEAKVDKLQVSQRQHLDDERQHLDDQSQIAESQSRVRDLTERLKRCQIKKQALEKRVRAEKQLNDRLSRLSKGAH